MLCTQNHAAERDSRLKPRQSLTSGKVTHHISFRLSISGDAASFCVFFFFGFFPSSEAAGTAEPLFQPRSLFFKRKLQQECCVCYHRRESEALIQHAAMPGSKRAQNDTNQSLRRVLREEFLLFWRRCNASPIVRSLARKTHISSVHRSNGVCVCVLSSLSASISAYSL